MQPCLETTALEFSIFCSMWKKLIYIWKSGNIKQSVSLWHEKTGHVADMFSVQESEDAENETTDERKKRLWLRKWFADFEFLALLSFFLFRIFSEKICWTLYSEDVIFVLALLGV